MALDRTWAPDIDYTNKVTLTKTKLLPFFCIPWSSCLNQGQFGRRSVKPTGCTSLTVQILDEAWRFASRTSFYANPSSSFEWTTYNTSPLFIKYCSLNKQFYHSFGAAIPEFLRRNSRNCLITSGVTSLGSWCALEWIRTYGPTNLDRLNFVCSNK